MFKGRDALPVGVGGTCQYQLRKPLARVKPCVPLCLRVCVGGGEDTGCIFLCRNGCLHCALAYLSPHVQHSSTTCRFNTCVSCLAFCLCAGRLVSEMRGGVTANTDPKSITPQQAVRLHQLLHEVSNTAHRRDCAYGTGGGV